MNTITYSLTPVNDEITGGEKVYRANVRTNGTRGPEEIAAAIAEKTKQDKSLAMYFLNALDEQLAKEIAAGYRVNLGQLSTGFAVKGAFRSADDRWDPARHLLVPTIRALDPLRSALAAVKPENITVGLSCSVYSLIDNVTKETNAITGSNVVHIQGVNIGIDPDNADEYVALFGADGALKATATVDESDAQTISCSFASAPEPGVYTLVVSARNGNRVSLAPAIGRLRNIVIKAAQ